MLTRSLPIVYFTVIIIIVSEKEAQASGLSIRQAIFLSIQLNRGESPIVLQLTT